MALIQRPLCLWGCYRALYNWSTSITTVYALTHVYNLCYIVEGISLSEWVSASEQWISNTIEWLTQARAVGLLAFTEGFEEDLEAIIDLGLLSKSY